MRFQTIFLFSESIRRLMLRFKKLLILSKRFISILFKWNKRLNVESLLINDILFIENGFLIINWRIKNFLFVRINGVITLNPNGVAFPYHQKEIPIKIVIQGLFGRYENEFLIKSHGKMNSKIFSVLTLESEKYYFTTLANSICNFFPAINFTLINPEIKTLITEPKISLPSFNKEKYYA